MTRIVPVALVLVAILAFAGCSSGGETGESRTVTVNTASPPTAPSTDAPAPADAGAQRNPGNLLENTQYGLYERVSFPAGSSGTTISAATVRGTVNGYVLEARAGQVMTVSIASLESNAVFDVYAPDDTQVFGENDQIFLLPADGDYLIVVSSTRGNSSYELNIDVGDEVVP